MNFIAFVIELRKYDILAYSRAVLLNSNVHMIHTEAFQNVDFDSVQVEQDLSLCISSKLTSASLSLINVHGRYSNSKPHQVTYTDRENSPKIAGNCSQGENK